MFGSVLELLYAPESPAVPRTNKSTNVRRNPVPRDAIVPNAIALLDRARFGDVSSAARCGPVDGASPMGRSRILVRLSRSSTARLTSTGVKRGAAAGA